MVFSECYGCIKNAFVCVNLTFGTINLAAIVLAIWMLTDPTFLVSITQEQHNFNDGLYILLAAGILMLTVDFLGCYGAFRESQCILVSYFSCLLVVIVAQIAAGAWLYTNSSRLEELVKTSVINTVKNEYGMSDKYSRTETVDAFQSGLGCCGATGPADWAGSKYAGMDSSNTLSLTVSTDANNVFKVPESCCKDKESAACKTERNILLADIVSPAIYSEGCVDKLVATLHSSCPIAIGVAIGIGILELLGLVFSLVLCCAIGSSNRYKA